MNRLHGKDLVPVITLIRICYGRFNSFRIPRLGMQKITEIYQFKNSVNLIDSLGYVCRLAAA